MNLTMIDVSQIKDVKIGDEVVIIGQQGKGEITAEHLATTINYEIIVRLNSEIPRIVVG